MPPRTRESNQELAAQLRRRREDLGLSIEEAARRAGVGTKTWSRYESGASIRVDKLHGVCKALGWAALPPAADDLTSDDDSNDLAFLEAVDESHEAWSSSLASGYGFKAAVSFAVGTDLLLEGLRLDLRNLRAKPKGTHVGELETSWTAELLPAQFLMEYDYELLYRLVCVTCEYRRRASRGDSVASLSVAEDLVAQLAFAESSDFVSRWTPLRRSGLVPSSGYGYGWDRWVVDLCDRDLGRDLLEGSRWVGEDDPFHLDHWFEEYEEPRAAAVRPVSPAVAYWEPSGFDRDIPY